MREVPLYLHHMITTQVPSTRAFALERQTRSERINAFCAVLSTEGRVVGPCWEILKPKGPKVVPPLTSCVSLPLTQTHTISHLLSLSPTLALLLSLSLSLAVVGVGQTRRGSGSPACASWIKQGPLPTFAYIPCTPHLQKGTGKSRGDLASLTEKIQR